EEGAIARQPEEARQGGAGLWLGGNGADLDEAKPEGEDRADTLGVLVEAGGEAQGAGGIAAERVHAGLGGAGGAHALPHGRAARGATRGRGRGAGRSATAAGWVARPGSGRGRSQ